ncbi:acyltransferase [Rhodoblastus sp.]|uniref:acyltransferase family protein n=1 Tax=Rhodoblastus sp. TaxID=1962975 RepID=UPI002612A82D|nr:acyltransferase [Rhodoblastus sp.]
MSYPIPGLLAGLFLYFLGAILVADGVARLGFPLPAGEKRIGQIDGLRGFLCLAVMFHHFVVWMQIARLGGRWEQPTINFFQMIGSGAVALFFMATGLLFYPRIRAGFSANNWPSIFVSRVFRIIPLSIVAVSMVTGVIMFHTGRGLDEAYPEMAFRWITATGMPPLLGYEDSARVSAYVLWTLNMEWIFYLLALPACALLMELFHRRRWPSWTLPVVLILAGIVLKKAFHDVAFWKYLPMFATGMLSFELSVRPDIARWFQSRPVTFAALASLLFAVVVFKSPLDLAWPFLAFFFMAVACGNDLGGLLRSRAAVVLGECSYGMYLMHGMFLFLLFNHGQALTNPVSTPLLPLFLPLLALVLVPLVSTTYLLVERPGMKTGHYLARRLRKSAHRKAPAGSAA